MNFIDGQWVEGSGAALVSTDPSDGSIVWEGKAATDAEVKASVAAARKAFPGWSAKSFEERLAVLNGVKARMEADQGALAELIAREMGKVLWDAKSEAAAVIGKFAFAEAAYRERTGTSETKNEKLGFTSTLRHKPHGVMAVYGPYNFPAHLPNGHIVPALLAGNTVVFKPSEQTPAVAEWMVRHWEAAGLPKGVLNLVQGERDTGMSLADSRVDGVLFTGSSATGKAIHKQFGGRPEVILALEMGGNNALVVYEPEDIRAAVRETILSAFITSGQRCTCARRLILPKWKQRDEFIALLLKTAPALKIGTWRDKEEAFMGPMVSRREAERVLAGVDLLESRGGSVLLRGRFLDVKLPFLSPSIVDVTSVAEKQDEEYFGPLLQIVQVEGIKEAWDVANATQYGLSAGIICKDRKWYDEACQKLHVGLVNWNRQTTGASGSAPFGGVGTSGNHRPAGYYAADYCAFPVASIEVHAHSLPEKLEPGLTIP